jgi:hypothetical protein
MDGERRRRFHGFLRFIGGSDRLGSVVNVIDIEEYLVGVVSAELHRGFHQEAFRAQAIAARTYAWYMLRTGVPTQLWDITATEATQVYWDLDRAEEVPEAARAVRDTAGLVCTWNAPTGERIFKTYYSSTCGGCTHPGGEPPPLRGNVRCPHCARSPYATWGPVSLTKNLITERLRQKFSKFRTLGPITRMEVKEMTECGRAALMEFFDAKDESIVLPTEMFR